MVVHLVIIENGTNNVTVGLTRPKGDWITGMRLIQ